MDFDRVLWIFPLLCSEILCAILVAYVMASCISVRICKLAGTGYWWWTHHDVAWDLTLQYVWIVFYLTAHTPHAHHFARRQAMLRSPLFHVAVTRGLGVLVQCTAINTRILIVIFKEGTENIVFCLTDTLLINIHIVQCTSKYYMSSEVMENGWNAVE